MGNPEGHREESRRPLGGFAKPLEEFRRLLEEFRRPPWGAPLGRPEIIS